jgi:hypothetical protein
MICANNCTLIDIRKENRIIGRMNLKILRQQLIGVRISYGINIILKMPLKTLKKDKILKSNILLILYRNIKES